MSNHQAGADPVSPNAKRLLAAGFTAILATGVGFAIRGAILGSWESIFKFTGLEVGLINGAGFTGFCFAIIIGGILADKIGYGKLVITAFLLHVISAIILVFVSDTMNPKTAFALLWTSVFIFSLRNGTLEAVANPLVAPIVPSCACPLSEYSPCQLARRDGARWFCRPIFGGVLHWGWKGQILLYLVPTIFYGLMFLGQKFPRSEASRGAFPWDRCSRTWVWQVRRLSVSSSVCLLRRSRTPSERIHGLRFLHG